jgi:hypothetical protein
MIRHKAEQNKILNENAEQIAERMAHLLAFARDQLHTQERRWNKGLLMYHLEWLLPEITSWKII